MSDQIEDTIRKFALQNAIFFKGKANPRPLSEKCWADARSSVPRQGR